MLKTNCCKSVSNEHKNVCTKVRMDIFQNTSVFQVPPFLPLEYTCEGMLERVDALIANQVRNSANSLPQSKK